MAAQHGLQEFSRVASASRALDGGVSLSIQASGAECSAIARRLSIAELGSLRAEARLSAGDAPDAVLLSVRWAADVVQYCVVTLDPIANRLEETFELTFAPAGSGRSVAEHCEGDVAVGIDEADPPEPLVGDEIDVGEAVVEHLALALDPYPRKADAELPVPYRRPVTATTETDSPFVKLKELRGRL